MDKMSQMLGRLFQMYEKTCSYLPVFIVQRSGVNRRLRRCFRNLLRQM
jgi:hypothetical protein